MKIHTSLNKINIQRSFDIQPGINHIGAASAKSDVGIDTPNPKAPQKTPLQSRVFFLFWRASGLLSRRPFAFGGSINPLVRHLEIDTFGWRKNQTKANSMIDFYRRSPLRVSPARPLYTSASMPAMGAN